VVRAECTVPRVRIFTHGMADSPWRITVRIPPSTRHTFVPIHCPHGFTMVEILIALLILGTIVGIAVPSYMSYLDRARIAKAIADIRTLDSEIQAYATDKEKLPDSLGDVGRNNLSDPYGNPYEYANYDLIPPGKRRKDQFLVPLNSDYDLYSKGKDGDSTAPLTAKASRDDIVRANDGKYIGLASDY
jgi:general secretion pathway protein G